MILVLATPVKGKDLKPGDLFSTHGPEYWNDAIRGSLGQVGERVFVRTEGVTPPHCAEDDVYRIEFLEKVAQ